VDRHNDDVYIIGKTGTGKSTLIETMALQDLERGNTHPGIAPG
jgi:ABC-type lipoprotein export system ATPase subunit